jgi:hypothetical protein
LKGEIMAIIKRTEVTYGLAVRIELDNFGIADANTFEAKFQKAG